MGEPTRLAGLACMAGTAGRSQCVQPPPLFRSQHMLPHPCHSTGRMPATGPNNTCHRGGQDSLDWDRKWAATAVHSCRTGAGSVPAALPPAVPPWHRSIAGITWRTARVEANMCGRTTALQPPHPLTFPLPWLAYRMPTAPLRPSPPFAVPGGRRPDAQHFCWAGQLVPPRKEGAAQAKTTLCLGLRAQDAWLGRGGIRRQARSNMCHPLPLPRGWATRLPNHALPLFAPVPCPKIALDVARGLVFLHSRRVVRHWGRVARWRLRGWCHSEVSLGYSMCWPQRQRGCGC